MSVNRIVTGHDPSRQAELKSVGLPPGTRPLVHSPGFEVARVWHTPAAPIIEAEPRDDAAGLTSVLPDCGGTTALMVTFPPDDSLSGPGYNPQQAAAEFGERLPGLAETFETDGSGYHTTSTIDYGVVIEGEVFLDLGNGHGQHLRQGDVVVQVGTRHAWRNLSRNPVRMFFVLIGATRAVQAG